MSQCKTVLTSLSDVDRSPGELGKQSLPFVLPFRALLFCVFRFGEFRAGVLTVLKQDLMEFRGGLNPKPETLNALDL